MILGRPVYDENMCLLLGANKKLTQNNINKLKELGYAGLYILEHINDDADYIDVVSESIRKEAKNSLRLFNLDAVIFYSNKIVEELRSHDSIYIDMMEMRNYDDYTYSHSVNVAILSTIIGIGLGLSNKNLQALSLAGLLHDIGKIRIPEEIIKKPDKLTAEEMEIVQLHPELSYEIIKNNYDIPTPTKVAIRLHHENEDGSGYPYGITSDKIYLLAKILHVADVYDALISKRPYKNAFCPAEAIEYMMGNCGNLFHHEIVTTFIRYVSPYPIGIEVELSTGYRAIVVRTNRICPLRPVVKTNNGIHIDLTLILNITILKIISA